MTDPELNTQCVDETPADRLLRFFTATERLLHAADAVREASDAIVAPQLTSPANGEEVPS